MRASRDPSPSSRRASGAPARAFTLTEVLVAVAILVVVIIATARIFGTVSKVTGAGEANADILQTAAVIERQIRSDIARISQDGFIVIRNVEVPNNINQIGAPGGGPLLNGALPAGARTRCDQLLFFVDGTDSSSQFSGSKGLGGVDGNGVLQTPVWQSTAARVYYGHAYQLREAPPGADPFLGGMENGQPVMPWTYSFPGNNDYRLTTVRWDTGAAIKDVIASQPSSRDWILARQLLLLANDPVINQPLNDLLRFQVPATRPKNSTAAIWPLASSTAGVGYDSGPFASRVDIAASTLDIVQATVNPRVRSDNQPWVDNAGFVRGFAPYWNSSNHPPDGDTQNWPQQGGFPGQRAQMIRALTGGGPNPLRYPRAERVPPKGGLDRADQMLSNPALANGCSSFIVDWTWADGTGRMERPSGAVIDPTPSNPGANPNDHLPNFSGDEFVGFVLNDKGPQPWFGLLDANRGVAPLCSMPPYDGNCVQSPGCLGNPISPYSVEGYSSSTPTNPQYTIPGLSGVRVYEATFGMNQDQPLLPGINGTNSPNFDLGYTPWPTAIRVTFTLHDPQQRFPEGRTFEFIVELPKR